VATRISTRPRLQRSAVVARAMDMADTEGLDALTIRRLATELGVTPMALYWHFADKDALLHAISERLWDDAAAIVAGADAGDPEAARPGPSGPGPSGQGPAGWASLRMITAGLVEALRRHPGCAQLAFLAVLGCESGLALTERSLAILADQGFDARQSAEMAHFLLTSAVTLVASRPGGDISAEDQEARLRAKRVSLASLPPERYPHVAVTAEYLVDCSDVDGYLERGVDFIIGGLQHRL
jgi:AcrR family transcriptional regulator